MTLTGEQLTWLFLGQLVFGAILVITGGAILRGRVELLFNQRTGKTVLQVITIFFTCTITGNLALMKILEPAAAAALFGSVLGYAFGVGTTGKQDQEPKGPSTTPKEQA